MQGSRGCVVCAVASGGKEPAYEFLEELSAKDKARFYKLFERLVEKGKIWNPEQFKKEMDDIWSFKRYQSRIACYRDGLAWVLTHGFVKKSNKWKKTDTERAQRIRNEDQARK